MRRLSSILAFVAIAIVFGHLEPERLADTHPKSQLWSDSEAGHVLGRACENCHSNHTNWPWYSHVPPVSWWIAEHVREGREKLNFSQWQVYSTQQKRDKLESICGLILMSRMPPSLYAAMHPEASLSENDKETVCAWVEEQRAAIEANASPDAQ